MLQQQLTFDISLPFSYMTVTDSAMIIPRSQDQRVTGFVLTDFVLLKVSIRRPCIHIDVPNNKSRNKFYSLNTPIKFSY